MRWKLPLEGSKDGACISDYRVVEIRDYSLDGTFITWWGGGQLKLVSGEYSVNTVLAGRCGEICKGTTKA